MSVSTYLPRRIVPGAMYEVTDRTFCGQHLFSPDLRRRIEAVLWRAAKVSRVRVFAYVFMTNHYHLLVAGPGPREFSQFLQLLHSGVAAAVNSGRARVDRVWARRADVVPVSAEPGAQLQRLAYILANSVKEGAVAHPAAWTGPHCAHDFYAGGDGGDGGDMRPPTMAPADLPKNPNDSDALGKRYTCQLPPLPHLAHLERSTWLSEMRSLCDSIAAAPEDRDAWLEPHLLDPTLPRPAAAPHPRTLPVPPPPRPASARPAAAPRATRPPASDRPRDRYPVHALDPAQRQEMRRELEAFHDQYARASTAFRAGDGFVAFPAHCIKPPQAWTSGAVDCDSPTDGRARQTLVDGPSTLAPAAA